MKLPAIALAVTICGIGSIPAEEKKIDLEARKRSIPILEDHLKEREERLTEIVSDIRRLDTRLESKVDRIVKKLASIKDSKTSGYRVSQIKNDAIEGLKRSIETYKSRRTAVIREAREKQTSIPTEVLEGDAAKFDARIEKRVAQILQISKSFTQEADVKKYEKVEGGGGYGRFGWGDNTQISDEWRQNRRDRTMDGKQRKEIFEALEKSIERNESSIANLEQNLKKSNLSKTDRELMTTELARNKAILASREEQQHEMREIDTPHTAAVNRDEAHDLQEALADATTDLRQDFQNIFAKYAELNRERDKAFKAKANLEARKKWLADYIKKGE